MSDLVVAPMAVALVGSVLTLLVRRRWRLQVAVSVTSVLAYAAAVGVLAGRVLPGTRLTYQLGGWAAPFGISLVADPLSVFMLLLTVAVAVPALVYAVRSVERYGQTLSFHPLFFLLLLGVTGSLLTGDVFNLFVWFEVMLMASYALVAFEGGPAETRAAFYYLVLNLVGSALMLLAIGGLYATTGTLNMADMARRLASPETWSVAAAPVLGLGALLLAVFLLKAGVAPFHFWVPEAYRAAPAPVTAMLAGVTKKVGIYALVRLYFTVFAPAGVTLEAGLADTPLAYLGPVLLVLAAASVVLGGVAAVARADLEGVLAYSSISQVGFIVLPLAVAATVPAVRVLAVAAALVYALNHALAKAMLFLVAGTVRDATGTGTLDELGGLTGRAPVLSGAFLLGAFSLVGIPPLSGFFGKLLVFDAAVQGDAAVALAVALVGAVLTVAYYTRTWNRAFWGERTAAVETATPDPVQVGVVAVLAVAVVAVGLGFDPVFRAAEDAARVAVDTRGYVDAVLGPEAWAAGPTGGEGS